MPVTYNRPRLPWLQVNSCQTLTKLIMFLIIIFCYCLNSNQFNALIQDWRTIVVLAFQVTLGDLSDDLKKSTGVNVFMAHQQVTSQEAGSNGGRST